MQEVLRFCPEAQVGSRFFLAIFRHLKDVVTAGVVVTKALFLRKV